MELIVEIQQLIYRNFYQKFLYCTNNINTKHTFLYLLFSQQIDSIYTVFSRKCLRMYIHSGMRISCFIHFITSLWHWLSIHYTIHHGYFNKNLVQIISFNRFSFINIVHFITCLPKWLHFLLKKISTIILFI